MNYDLDYVSQVLMFMIADIKAVQSYLPMGVLLVGTACICSIGLLFLLALNKKQYIGSAISCSMLLGYCVIVFFIAVFSRVPGSRSGIDLLPFATFGNSIHGDAYVYENILFFVPIGILFSCTFRKKRSFFYTIGFGCLLSILIETCQFITKRGHVQTDDVITNILGTWIGYILFHVMYQLRRKTERQKGVCHL